jgi:hypothetical protein
MSKLSVTSYFPLTLPIDGTPVALRIARLTAREFFAFAKDYDRATDPVSERKLLLRTAEELTKQPVPRERTAAEAAAAEALEALREGLQGLESGAALTGLLAPLEALLPPEPTSEEFVVSDAEVRKRRLEEMGPDQKAAWEQQDADDERFAASFIVETITRWVQAEAGEIDVDGEPLTAGADLVRVFGGQADVLKAMVRAVRDENLLPTPLKNAWRSARASKPSSSTPDRDQPGPAPVPTAPPADERASAPDAAAMGLPNPAPSGAIATSS